MIKEIVDHFGIDLQKFVACEEMAELIQALSKNVRGQDNLENIKEEIVDVQIMLDQLRYIFDYCEEDFALDRMIKLVKVREKIDER